MAVELRQRTIIAIILEGYTGRKISNFLLTA
jgi:hypothetical protein